MARPHAKNHSSKHSQQQPATPRHNTPPPQRNEPVQARPAQDLDASAASRRTAPSHEQICQRAYELFLSRGGEHGRHEEDWAQAERDLGLGR